MILGPGQVLGGQGLGLEPAINLAIEGEGGLFHTRLIGVEGLEKTVVSAAEWRDGRWVDVAVKLRVPSGAGGMVGLPEFVDGACSRVRP